MSDKWVAGARDGRAARKTIDKSCSKDAGEFTRAGASRGVRDRPTEATVRLTRGVPRVEADS